MKLYVAYGSNLNMGQMKYRCPNAKYVCSGYLNNWELIYRGSKTGSYATIRRKKGCMVPVGLWQITDNDERNLDSYEGYPTFYHKENVFVLLDDGTRKKAMVYIMRTNAKPGVPSDRYVQTCRQGYKDCGLDESFLDASLILNISEVFGE